MTVCETCNGARRIDLEANWHGPPGVERHHWLPCPDCAHLPVAVGDPLSRCEGQPEGEPTCDEKINYWIGRWREACAQLEQVRAELSKAEPILVAADRIHDAYAAMLAGEDIGSLPEWKRPS